MLELLNSGLNPYVDEIKSNDLQLMYRKSGGGFGVTNGTLADPAVAQVYVPKPEPEEPNETDPDPGTATDPGITTDPGGEDPGTNPNPEDPGDTSQPGEENPPPNIGDIDPSQVFPEVGTQGGNDRIAADGLNFPAQTAA